MREDQESASRLKKYKKGDNDADISMPCPES